MAQLFVTQQATADLDTVLPIFRCDELPGAGPLTKQEVASLAAAFAQRSIAESYLGPSLVTEDGRAVVVLIAKSPDALRAMRRADRVRLICWRWDSTPTGFLSLSLSVPGSGTVAPCPRWIGADDAPVVQAIQRTGKVTFIVVNTKGEMSPWYAGTFGEKGVAVDLATRRLEALFALPLPSPAIREFAAKLPDELQATNTDARRTTDFWALLHELEPFWADLGAADRARTVWAKEASDALLAAVGVSRELVAEHKQGLPEANWADGFPPAATALATALIGPEPNPLAAIEAMQEVLRDPYATYCTLGVLPAALADDTTRRHTFGATMSAALLDPRVTDAGRQRPWFRNQHQSLQWESLAVSPQAPLDAIATLWETGCDYVNLLNGGLFCTPELMPLPLAPARVMLRAIKLDGSLDDTHRRIEELLYEGHDARQWSIPWGARVQVAIGTFTSVRIYEVNGEFTCHFLDPGERFLPVALGVDQGGATYACPTLFNRLPPDERPPLQAAGAALLLIAAAIIRDFLVVEDRTSVFTGRAYKHRRPGQRGTTIIYLPRVRYSRTVTHPPAVNPDATARVRHAVQQHLRRVGTTSQQQRLLAMKYGVHLPMGYTFVRPHERGGIAEEERKRIYRSRSASLLLFNAIDPGPNTSTPAWFKFERDCAEVLRRQGMTVVHHAATVRDGDGGMDLYCVNAAGDKRVVQCKCWALNRAIGPEVVRELVGTMRLVDADSGSTSQGMIISTTRFTEGAVSAAAELGITLIDGTIFARMLQESSAS